MQLNLTHPDLNYNQTLPYLILAITKPGPSHPEPSLIQKPQYGLSMAGVQPYDIPTSASAGVQNIHLQDHVPP